MKLVEPQLHRSLGIVGRELQNVLSIKIATARQMRMERPIANAKGQPKNKLLPQATLLLLLSQEQDMGSVAWLTIQAKVPVLVLTLLMVQLRIGVWINGALLTLKLVNMEPDQLDTLQIQVISSLTKLVEQLLLHLLVTAGRELWPALINQPASAQLLTIRPRLGARDALASCRERSKLRLLEWSMLLSSLVQLMGMVANPTIK